MDIQKKLKAYREVLAGLAGVVTKAQNIINDALEEVQNKLARPLKDNKGNITFSSDFKLDLSKYGLDSEKDYKQLIDEYYEKMNKPAEPEKPAEEEKAGNQEKDGTSPGSNPGYSPSYPSYVPDNPSPTPTPEVPTEEKPTEHPTEEKPEDDTEEILIEPTEHPTGEEPSTGDITTEHPTSEIPVEKPTEGKKPSSGKKPSGGTSHKPSSGGINTKPANENVDALTPPVENNPEPVEDLPVEDYVEPTIEPDPVEEYIMDEYINEQIPEVEEPKKGNGLKALGIASGVGLAVGAAALGAHTMTKKKEEDEEYEDYGYDE